MALLCTCEWSFGRDKALLREFESVLSGEGTSLHDLQSDPDLNRTFASFSGPVSNATDLVVALASLAVDRIDLQRHAGSYPRLGALDLCSWSILGSESEAEVQQSIDATAMAISIRYGVPIFYQEKSNSGRSESELPRLRKGGLGSLLGRPLNPNVGPLRANPSSGVTIMGLRDYRLAFYCDIHTQETAACRFLAHSALQHRALGDDRFLGIRAMALPLASQGKVRLFFESTLPDLTDVDPIVEWLEVETADLSLKMDRARLLGAIRQADLLGAGRVEIQPRQVIQEQWNAI